MSLHQGESGHACHPLEPTRLTLSRHEAGRNLAVHERVAELEAQLQEAEAAAELSGTAPALTLEQATEALIDQLAGLTLAELREWQQSFSVRLGHGHARATGRRGAGGPGGRGEAHEAQEREAGGEATAQSLGVKTSTLASHPKKNATTCQHLYQRAR
jgi:hypothetical protein